MIGIIGAMEEELVHLKNGMQVESVSTKAGMDFCCGKFLGKEVVIVKCGVGKVNAAVCAQILIDEYNVDCLINSGIAGSLDAKINIADIVISSDVVHHDMDATTFGYKLGHVPGMDTYSFFADENLIKIAKKSCENVLGEDKVHIGRIVSGDQFICEKDIKEKLVLNYNPLCTEMEGAAIAQTAYINKIPFVIIRAISDKADGSEFMEYLEFEKKASDYLIRIMEEFISNI